MTHDEPAWVGRLATGKVLDDKGNVYPPYMELSADGIVLLRREAIQIFCSLARVISH
jgi:hypothetical protein